MSEVIPAEFARICGVAPSVISRKIKNNTLVKNAAGLLDTDNQVNVRYAAKRRLKLNAEALEDDGKNAERAIKSVDFSAFTDFEISERIGLPQKLLKKSIRELVIEYKGMDGIERYVRMLKDLSAADEKDQRVQERRLQLIEKDFVIARLFQYVDVLMRQLLEYPKSAVDGLVSLVQSSGSDARQDVIKKMEAGLSRIIKDSKEQVVKELGGLRAKYQKDNKLADIKQAMEEVMDE